MTVHNGGSVFRFDISIAGHLKPVISKNALTDNIKYTYLYHDRRTRSQNTYLIEYKSNFIC